MPARIQHDGHALVGSLHHGVVDGDRRTHREGICIQSQEVQIALRSGNGGSRTIDDFRLELRELLQQRPRREQEYASIPPVVSLTQEVLRRGLIRLLDKPLDLE